MTYRIINIQEKNWDVEEYTRIMNQDYEYKPLTLNEPWTQFLNITWKISVQNAFRNLTDTKKYTGQNIGFRFLVNCTAKKKDNKLKT